MVNREVSGAHYGLRGWLAQRATAVVMAAYTLFFLVALTRLPQLDYWHWKALWGATGVRFATILFVLSVLAHAWVGVRNIFMDYIKDAGLRLTLYVIVIILLAGYGAWTIQILWGL
jgi:succinate dehydrogenase / fumarate reductase membrane anchor subunit